MKSGPDFVPLKLLVLMMESYAFNRVYAEHQYSERFDPNVQEAEVFASFLANLVTGPVLFRSGRRMPVLKCSMETVDSS